MTKLKAASLTSCSAMARARVRSLLRQHMRHVDLRVAHVPVSPALLLGSSAGRLWPGGVWLKRLSYGSPCPRRPSATMRLSSMRMARSQNSRTALMLWVTNTMVVPALLEGVEVLEALALEGRVADGQDLVDEQYVGPGTGGHREGDAHLHAGGVVLQLLVHGRLRVRRSRRCRRTSRSLRAWRSRAARR